MRSRCAWGIKLVACSASVFLTMAVAAPTPPAVGQAADPYAVGGERAEAPWTTADGAGDPFSSYCPPTLDVGPPSLLAPSSWAELLAGSVTGYVGSDAAKDAIEAWAEGWYAEYLANFDPDLETNFPEEIGNPPQLLSLKTYLQGAIRNALTSQGFWAGVLQRIGSVAKPDGVDPQQFLGWMQYTASFGVSSACGRGWHGMDDIRLWDSGGQLFAQFGVVGPESDVWAKFDLAELGISSLNGVHFRVVPGSTYPTWLVLRRSGNGYRVAGRLQVYGYTPDAPCAGNLSGVVEANRSIADLLLVSADEVHDWASWVPLVPFPFPTFLPQCPVVNAGYQAFDGPVVSVLSVEATPDVRYLLGATVWTEGSNQPPTLTRWTRELDSFIDPVVLATGLRGGHNSDTTLQAEVAMSTDGQTIASCSGRPPPESPFTFGDWFTTGHPARYPMIFHVPSGAAGWPAIGTTDQNACGYPTMDPGGNRVWWSQGGTDPGWWSNPAWPPGRPEPALTVTKTADHPEVVAGQDISYTIVLENTGGGPLTNIALHDPIAPDCDRSSLTLGTAESVVVHCTKATTLADIGLVTNVATADSDETEPVSSNEATTTVVRPSATEIQGTVTDSSSGESISDAFVAVLRTSDFAIAAGAVADENGTYTAALPAGEYFLYLIDPTGAHAAGFQGAPDPVTVTEGDAAVVDPTMASTRGAIAATVTDASTGDPIEGAWGLALSTSAANTGATEQAVTADGAGDLVLSGLRAGNHFVGFVDPSGAHESRFWPDSPNVPDSTPVTVTAANATTADVVLPAQAPTGTEATISGTVTESGSGDPVGSARVVALRASDFAMVRGATADANGGYSLDVAPGDYKLAVLDGDGLHAMEWFDDQPNTGLGDAATVTAPQAGVDAALAPTTGTLAGTIVDDPSGDPLGGVWVVAIGPSGIAGGAVTAADGSYSIGGLPAGTYRVTFADPNGGRTQEYYDDSPDYPGATPFAITAGTTVAVDAALALP